MGGMNLFGMGPGQLDELQRLRRQKMEADTLAQRTQGLSPARARAYGVGFRAGGGVGRALGLLDQQEDPDIAQARMMQEATQGIMNSPEFQKMNPFQQRTVLARQAAQTAARLGNPALASQLLSQATAAMKEEADYIASTKPGAAKTPTKIAEIEMAAQALGLPETDPRVQSAYSRILTGDKAQDAVDRKAGFAQRVYGMTPDEALGYALGFINVETDPESNRLLITDKLKGETIERKFGPTQQRRLEGAMNTGEGAKVETEPEVILPQTTAILESPRSIMDILSETNITGPVAGVTRIAEKASDVVSTVFDGKPQPIPTIAATQAFNLWKKDLIDSLRTSVRNAVTEIDVIQKQVKVEPGPGKGKTEFMSELSTVAEWLASKHKEYSDFANNPGNPQSERDQDKKSAQTIRASLTKLVGPERVNELLGTQPQTSGGIKIKSVRPAGS
jgi:hypothetical protein